MSPASQTLDRALTALADPARRHAVELLRRRPHRAGELAAALDMSPAAMSRHLRVLRRGGLVEDSGLPDDARVRVYRLRRQPFTALRSWLEGVESFWATELAAFAEHAERTRGGRRR